MVKFPNHRHVLSFDERDYIISGFHHSELVGAVEKPSESVARLCGHAVVIDEDMMAHAQMGDDNLLIFVGITVSVLEVDADHLVLVSSKQLLSVVDVVVHHGWVDGVNHREIRLPCVGLHSCHGCRYCPCSFSLLV